MDEIAELEGRITRALDRIRAGVDRVAAAPAAPGPETVAEPALQDDDSFSGEDGTVEALAEADAERAALALRLEEEQSASAALEERVQKLKERQDDKIAGLETRLRDSRARLAAMGEELQKLRQVNADLRAISDQVREAMAAGVSEPHLVNKAMLAEIDALRALRETEAAEIDAVLAELAPLAREEA